MNLHKRIESVVSNAPFFEACDPGHIDDSFDFTDKDDDFGIHLNPECLPDKPNEISFDVDNDRLSLGDLFGAFTDVTGRSFDKEYVELAERHEYEHWQAAKCLGATACRFGIEIYRVDPAISGKSFSIQPFSRLIDFRTTKLGDALVAGYPSFLSEGDRETILGNGYRGIEQLAKIAIKRNRDRRSPHEQFYPVPLTAKAKRSRKFFWPLKNFN